MATPPFENIFSGNSVGMFQGSMPAKFEVRVFSHFGDIGL